MVPERVKHSLAAAASTAMVVLAMGISPGTTRAAGGEPWVLSGNVQKVLSPAPFEASGVTDFPGALRQAHLASNHVRYYLIRGTEMPDHPGQYEYPFHLRKYVSGPVVATEMAINTSTHQELFAVGIPANSAVAVVKTRKAAHLKHGGFFTNLSPCDAGDTEFSPEGEATWYGQGYTAADDKVWETYCVYQVADYIYGQSGGYSPYCAPGYSSNDTGQYSGIYNNQTSSAEALWGDDLQCSGGAYSCEFDYQPIETDGYLTYVGYNDNTHVVSNGAYNCSALFSVTYNNT